ncbi:hypothetical protein VP01_4458g2 [Puccinia sorghi]|uniref:Uncharacterized protein n=1 Tax=Puccinia sorghi TaxID=27349 RepID=A0A0L6UPC7_9BASI|nr:hypothetical protein VP01_4458g2 [Puccinia sorghi]
MGLMYSKDVWRLCDGARTHAAKERYISQKPVALFILTLRCSPGRSGMPDCRQTACGFASMMQADAQSLERTDWLSSWSAYSCTLLILPLHLSLTLIRLYYSLLLYTLPHDGNINLIREIVSCLSGRCPPVSLLNPTGFASCISDISTNHFFDWKLDVKTLHSNPGCLCTHLWLSALIFPKLDIFRKYKSFKIFCMQTIEKNSTINYDWDSNHPGGLNLTQEQDMLIAAQRGCSTKKLDQMPWDTCKKTGFKTNRVWLALSLLRQRLLPCKIWMSARDGIERKIICLLDNFLNKIGNKNTRLVEGLFLCLIWDWRKGHSKTGIGTEDLCYDPVTPSGTRQGFPNWGIISSPRTFVYPPGLGGIIRNVVLGLGAEGNNDVRRREGRGRDVAREADTPRVGRMGKLVLLEIWNKNIPLDSGGTFFLLKQKCLREIPCSQNHTLCMEAGDNPPVVDTPGNSRGGYKAITKGGPSPTKSKFFKHQLSIWERRNVCLCLVSITLCTISKMSHKSLKIVELLP